MNQFLFILMMLAIAAAAIIFIPAYMTERAMVRVIRILREHQADDVWSAKMPRDLGLGPRTMADRFTDPRRDYKPMALAVLLKIGIVRETGNGKLYLSERNLSDFCSKNDNRLKACTLHQPGAGASTS